MWDNNKLNQANIETRRVQQDEFAAAIGGQCEVARKQTMIERGAEELGLVHQRLDALVGELERKINIILRPSIPAPQAGVGAQTKEGFSGSQMAVGLLQQAEAARYIADRLDEIINRVDL